MKIQLKPNEVIIKAGDSKYVINNNSIIDGKLIVTNQRLYFKPVIDDITSEVEIIFQDILDVIFYGNFFRQKGLNIVTRTGHTYNFPLKKRNEIGMAITKMF